MNDPNEFEKCRYIDTINDYNFLIEEFQKLYEQTPASDRFIRARILSGMKKSKRGKNSGWIQDVQEIQDKNCNKQIIATAAYT